MTSGIELGRAIYGPACAPYIVGAAIARAMVAFGDNAPWGVIRDGMVNSGWTLFVLCLVVMVFEIVAQTRNHNVTLGEAKARTALIAPPEAEPQAPEPRVPFPPVSFVEFIWNWRDVHGKFPTIQDCEESGINAQLAQYRYQQMVDAGYIVNRRERKSAGDPAWPRERFVEAAERSNTLRET